MRFRDYYFGVRRFQNIDSADNLKLLLRRCSKKYTDDEVLNERRIIIIHETDTFRSFLIFSNKRVYKIHDGINNNEPVVNWSMPLEMLKEQMSTIGLRFSKQNNIDLVFFPNEPDTKYSIDKTRFQTIKLETQIMYLLMNENNNLEQLAADTLKQKSA